MSSSKVTFISYSNLGCNPRTSKVTLQKLKLSLEVIMKRRHPADSSNHQGYYHIGNLGGTRQTSKITLNKLTTKKMSMTH